MKRREFITLLGGAAAAWPLAVRAQQPAMPVIGVISAGSRGSFDDLLAAFHLGLKDIGYVEGQNVAIEYRFAAGRFNQLPQIANDLARRRVAVMVSTGVGSALAANGASSTIPHVFLSQDDPVKLGFVASFNRPRGNATGVSLLTAELAAKRVELARQLMPRGAPLAYLMNPPAPEAPRYLQEIETIARAVKQELVVLKASNPEQIDAAIAEVARQRAGALIVSTDGYLFSRHEQIVTLAARDKVPTIYDRRGYVTAGGLVSYGPDLAGAYRQIGVYAARILKGEKPGDLPVVQPTKFELVVNLKTAKALGIDLPAQVLALADEVIE
jgi:putative tryptophan/tyrosine transport system substrate-binding protein